MRSAKIYLHYHAIDCVLLLVCKSFSTKGWIKTSRSVKLKGWRIFNIRHEMKTSNPKLLFTKCVLVITKGRAEFSIFDLNNPVRLRAQSKCLIERTPYKFRTGWSLVPDRVQTRSTYGPDCMNTWSLNIQVENLYFGEISIQLQRTTI